MKEATESLSARVTKNALFNAAGFFWSAAVLLFLVTYILARLGPELYGVWSLSLILSSYFGLFDFGFASTLVKFVAEYRTKGDVDSINSAISISLLFYLIIDIILLVSLLFVPTILNFLNIPDKLWDTASFVAQVAIVSFLLSNTFISIFVGLFNGFQRMDVTNRIIMLMGVPRVAGTIFVIESGYGLKGVVLNDLLIVILTIFVMGFVGRRMFPALSIRPRYVSWREFVKLFRFGSLLQVSVLSSVVNFHFDKILLSKFLGLTSLTFYDLGSRVTGKIRGLPLMVASSLMPAFSSLSAGGERERIQRIYLKASKMMLVFIIPLFGILTVIANELVEVWLGDGYGLTVLTIRVLSIAYCINVFTAIASTAAQGLGHPQIETKAAVIQTVLNLILSTVLLLTIGFSGVLIGTTLALVLGALYYVMNVNRLLAISQKTYSDTVLRMPLLYAVANVLLSLGVLSLLNVALHPSSAIGRLLIILIVSVTFLVTHALFLYRGSYFGLEERAEIRARLGGLWRKRASE